MQEIRCQQLFNFQFENQRNKISFKCFFLIKIICFLIIFSFKNLHEQLLTLWDLEKKMQSLNNGPQPHFSTLKDKSKFSKYRASNIFAIENFDDKKEIHNIEEDHPKETTPMKQEETSKSLIKSVLKTGTRKT